MKKYLPILQWLPNYKTSYLKGDLFAGFTVGVILIPQGIAYATIAGLPPVYGLYTALIPQLIYTIFGTSRHVATGPIAIDSLIIAAGVSTLAQIGTENYIVFALALTLMVGLIQILFGALKLGFAVNFLSKPVLTGFIAAAALIIGFNQFGGLFGVGIERSNQIQKVIQDIFEQFSSIHLKSLLVGVIAILFIYGLRKVNKKIPSALIIVIIGIVCMKFFQNIFSGVQIVEDIPSGLPAFNIPTLNYQLFVDMLPVALTLAFTGFLQVISIGKAFQKEGDKPKLDANQELISIGFSNVVGSLFSSYTTSASFSRSAINKEAGAHTAMASVFSAIFILLTLLFFTPAFYYLPKPILAAIIIVAVFSLIGIKEIKYLWKSNKKDFLMMLVTFVITLTIGIKEGILIGVAVSIFMIVFDTSKPHMAVLGRVPNTKHVFRNIERFDDVEDDKEVLIIRFDARLYFANAAYFREKVDEYAIAKGKDLKLIIIDAKAINNMDSSGLTELKNMIAHYNEKGIFVYLVYLKGPVRDMMSKSGFFDEFGLENCFLSLEEAIECFKEGDFSFNDKHKKYLNQANL